VEKRSLSESETGRLQRRISIRKAMAHFELSKFFMKTVIYWTSTILVSFFMLFVAIAYLNHQPKMMASFSSLGYPSYFPNILGVFKILGALALLLPRFPLLKEWAYAGFTFTFIGAFVSHVAINQSREAIMPVIALLLLVASYFTRPLSRRLTSSAKIVAETVEVKTIDTPNIST
jgi:hypothetical protein